ncbi:DAK2 domain-containing protein [Streptomyces sp. ZYX-F-203]
MARVPRGTIDAPAVRAWCGTALASLGRAREEIDAINVYPVADADTGTNLYLTLESATGAVEAVFTAHEPDGPPLADAVRAMAHGALLGARGNSGTILAQLLRGMAEVLGGEEGSGVDGVVLRRALRRASDSAREAVAHPVEGTVLSVAAAAAAAAEGGGTDCAGVVRAAHRGAREALARTPGQLPVLRRAGVVDAGGLGLVTVLGALLEVLTGVTRREPERRSGGDARGHGTPTTSAAPAPHAGTPADPAGVGEPAGGPAFEVVYLLEAEDTSIERLRARLDTLGESLVIVGGDGLWNVHVHVDDAGAAIEAGVEAGRPHRIRVTHFDRDDAHARMPATPLQDPAERARRAVVAVVPGEGLAALYAECGATTLLARPGEPLASGELAQAVRRAHAHEVIVLPNDAELRHTAAVAVEQVRAEGVRVALIPTRSAVQGIAALAVHEPGRRFDEDVVAMTSAAGATRYAEVAVAERQAWTTAGVCQAGDVLGLVDGDVAVIGSDVAGVAEAVLDRMLAAGGELVTLVLGDDAPQGVADLLRARVRGAYLAVDTVVHRGGRQGAPLLIGVE